MLTIIRDWWVEYSRRKILIKTTSLTKIYSSKNGDITAVDGIDLQVYEGDIFGFLGLNGAGKTTTIKMITGIINPTSGIAEVAGYDVVKHPLEVKKRIGAMPEEPGFYFDMTGRQNLEYYAKFYDGGKFQKNIDSVSERVGIDEYLDRKVKGYSHGMKKKLAIAQALIHEPSLLILDEPTMGLDPRASHFFIEFIKELNEEGITVFLSSHILPVVQNLCDRVGIIHEGRLLRVDSMDELSRELFEKKNRVEITIDTSGIDSVVLKKIRDIDDVLYVSKENNILKIETRNHNISAQINTILVENNIEVFSIDVNKPNLEKIFLEILGGD